MAIKNNSKILIFLLIAGIILFYGYYKVRNLTLGPEIKIDPVELVTENEIIEISGVANRIQVLYLNGNDIITNEKGQFKEVLILHPGYNIIELKGEDKFNRETKEILEITKK